MPYVVEMKEAARMQSFPVRAQDMTSTTWPAEHTAFILTQPGGFEAWPYTGIWT